MRSDEHHQFTHGHPVGHPGTHPVASRTTPSLTSVNTPLGSANDGAQQGTIPPKRHRKQRIRARDVTELASWLSERDFAILHSIDEHQFLTVRQVEAFHFADHTPASGARIARRVLAKLREYRLLGTFGRRVGGTHGGSHGLVHYLDAVGDQLLNSRSGRRARRFHEPSARFLSHRLAVADARIALIQADRSHLFELAACAVEPSAWRHYTGLGGARLALKTDLYAETAVPPGGEFVHAWFVEIDLGTESVTTLIRKCHEYESYRRSGVEQDATGSFPLVVWSITHPDPVKAERRREALRQAIAADRSLLAELFRVVTPQQLIGALQHRGQQ
jgi:hypothetical protein